MSAAAIMDDEIYFDSSSSEDDESIRRPLLGPRPTVATPSQEVPTASAVDDAGEPAVTAIFSGPRTLGVVELAFLTYFSVSGGPFGLEVAIAAGGPLWTLVCLLLFSLVVSLPSALMTAELSSALPGRGGYIHWIDRGLSPLLGSTNSYLALANSAVDASAYPGVCWDYAIFGLQRWVGFPVESGSVHFRFAFALVVTIGVLCVNLSGIRLASRTAVVLAAFSSAPFLLMGALCLMRPAISWSSLTSTLAEAYARRAPDVPLMIAVCLWSTSGFESASFVSAELKRPAYTLPRAMALAVVTMVVHAYMQSMCIGVYMEVTYIYIYVCMYIRVHAHMHAYIQVCISLPILSTYHACMHIYRSASRYPSWLSWLSPQESLLVVSERVSQSLGQSASKQVSQSVSKSVSKQVSE